MGQIGFLTYGGLCTRYYVCSIVSVVHKMSSHIVLLAKKKKLNPQNGEGREEKEQQNF